MTLQRPEAVAPARTAAVQQARRRGLTREDAEDCVQEAVLRAMTADPVLDDDERDVSAWLTIVSQRVHIDQVRRRHREQLRGEMPDLADRTHAGDPADIVVDRAHATYVAAGVRDLPETTQDVIDLIDVGRSVSEIAEDFGVSTAAVHKHLGRARQALRHRGRRQD